MAQKYSTVRWHCDRTEPSSWSWSCRCDKSRWSCQLEAWNERGTETALRNIMNMWIYMDMTEMHLWISTLRQTSLLLPMQMIHGTQARVWKKKWKRLLMVIKNWRELHGTQDCINQYPYLLRHEEMPRIPRKTERITIQHYGALQE